MKPQASREDQWMAYHLGELPEEERARVEAELNASPRLAESYRRFAAAITAWATEEVPDRPFDFEAFRAAQEDPETRRARTTIPALPRKKFSWPGRWTWALAAAALLLFALSTTHFTLTFGDATLRWGTPKQSAGEAGEEDALRAQLNQAREQLVLLQGGMEQNTEILQAIARRQIETEKYFTEVTERLGYYQQVEAAMRYRDTNALMNELAAYQPRRSP